MKTAVAYMLTIVMMISTRNMKAIGLNDLDRKLERAETLYKGGNFSNALVIYVNLQKSDTANCHLCYKIGNCYLKTGNQNKKAVYYLKKAVSSTSKYCNENSTKEKNAPVVAFKCLGDAFHLESDFDKAIENYEKFKQASINGNRSDDDLVKETVRKIEICNNAKELVQNPVEVKIANLGKNINSVHADYSPRLSADECTMIYTSRRPENMGGTTYDGGLFFEDIYIATRKNKDAVWPRAINIGLPVNTVRNEAAVGISADGQEMLIYKDDMGDGNIYSSKLKGNRWSVPAKLNSNINSKSWEPCAFISADGNVMYFVSDRPGGYGGTDIYKSKRTPNGEWGSAVNLGPSINSAYDEYSPFIHPDGVTLYFSSKGHKTMGGYDVFYSQSLASDERVWLQPVNIGYPINSPGDDAFYMVSPDNRRAYYSSFKAEGLGEKDNYMITFSDLKEAPLSLFKGEIVGPADLSKKNVVITVVDNETGQITGVYHPNSSSGKYLFILNDGKNHNISYDAEGCLFYSENQFATKDNSYKEANKDIKLQELAVGSKVTLNNVFFDSDQSKLQPNSQTELNKVFDFLTKYPKLNVEIAGYCDIKGSDEHNKKLALERANAVVNYLGNKGIDKKRMVARGYGKPYMGVAEKNKSKDNEIAKPSDRRVEMRILEM